MRARSLCLALSLATAGTGASAPPETARAFAKTLLAAETPAREALLAQPGRPGGADVVAALVETGNQLRRTNDLAGALDAFETAIRVADREGLTMDGANARREAGHVLSVFGRYAESRAYVEQARQTYQRLGDTLMEARTIVNLGILSRYTGDLNGALRAYAEARARAEGLGCLLYTSPSPRD